VLEAKLSERKWLMILRIINPKTILMALQEKQCLSLADADFPLVYTFDYLPRLIENNVRFAPPLLQLL